MSGHSHWAGIKHKKKLLDFQRSKVFSKLAREIEMAAREGQDPNFNPKLKAVIEKAKKLRLPTENIERAIKRGSGEILTEKLEEVLFEAYGPGGVVIIIEGITDNKNRSLGEIKQILNEHGGKLVSEGTVRWMFERKGVIIVDLKLQIEEFKDKEKLELVAIEAGADDIYWHQDVLDVYTKIEDLEMIKRNLMEKGIKIDSTSLDWVAKEEISVSEKDKEACQKLFEALDENEVVQEIYSNLKM